MATVGAPSRSGELESLVAPGGGSLIRPDLFVRTDFRLFCSRYNLPSCAGSSHLQSIVQQMLSKKLSAFPHSDRAVPAFISGLPTIQ